MSQGLRDLPRALIVQYELLSVGDAGVAQSIIRDLHFLTRKTLKSASVRPALKVMMIRQVWTWLPFSLSTPEGRVLKPRR